MVLWSLLVFAALVCLASAVALARRPRPVHRWPRNRIPLHVRRAVLARDGWRCPCGATTDLTIDHIWPLSRGGPDTEDNLRVLCRSCNSSKGAKTYGRAA